MDSVRSSRHLGRLGPVFAWAAVVAVLLFLPGGPEPSSFPWIAALSAAGGDKLVHVALFAVFGLLLARGLPRADVRSTLVLAVALGLAYGAVTELLQALLPGRAADVRDLVADGLGTFIGAWVFVRRVPPIPGERARGAEMGLPDC